MNETTTNATTPKTAKRSMADFFDLSKFEMPKIEVPAEFREMTDKGIAHAKDTCTKAKVASDEAVDLLKKCLCDRCQRRNRLQSQVYRYCPYQHGRRV